MKQGGAAAAVRNLKTEGRGGLCDQDGGQESDLKSEKVVRHQEGAKNG